MYNHFFKFTYDHLFWFSIGTLCVLLFPQPAAVACQIFMLVATVIAESRK